MEFVSTGLVHDYLLVMRGAERTFVAIADCWLDAPIYTLLYDRKAMRGVFGDRTVRTSYLQRLPVRQRGFRRLLPLFPHAVGRLPMKQHDLVISSSSAFAHGVRASAAATHISYCHSPFRYAWHERSRALEELPRPLRPGTSRVLDRIGRWDVAASQRVSHYIANSEITRTRIQEIYGRDATVVHPPVDVERFSVGEPEDFFLVVTELVPHKRVESALKAARRARRRVKVVGGGPELKRLSAIYGSSAELLGRVSDAELEDLYRRALALVVPNVEEFGIASVEAQAAGRPVLAVDGGGARETVLRGETGVLVQPNDTDALTEAMREVDWGRFDPAVARKQANRFSTDAFKRRFTDEVIRLAGLDPSRFRRVATGA